jgi:hypothetical protein
MKRHLSPRHSTNGYFSAVSKKDSALSKRKTTERWLSNIQQQQGLRFRHFLTLSFNKAQRSVINQYLDNKHIKKVILDFFYPNKKPNNRIRLWFFVERHSSGYLHLHILMEGVSGLDWLSKNNRNVTIRKSTLMDIVCRDFSLEDVMIEALTHHLQSYILRLGKGSQGVDMRSIGNIEKRIQYVNKSLDSLDFDKWEHIDYQNSDL